VMADVGEQQTGSRPVNNHPDIGYLLVGSGMDDEDFWRCHNGGSGHAGSLSEPAFRDSDVRWPRPRRRTMILMIAAEPMTGQTKLYVYVVFSEQDVALSPWLKGVAPCARTAWWVAR
jgi:hypothetical protein